MRKHGSRGDSAVAEAPARTFVAVDYPKEREVVTSPHYTFRVGASPEAKRVEVSVDGGEWQACREAVGYWWFDWSGYPSKASRRLAARMTTWDGEIAVSEPRRFSVKLPKAAGAPKVAGKAPRARKKPTRSPALEA